MKPKITIVGLGLIGGSLGMVIRKKKLARVIGLTSDREKADLAVKMKAVDYASTNIKGIIQDADIIFICYPIHLIIPEIKKIIQFVKPGAIITDVGSSKEMIVREAEKIMPKGVFFIGGHPMAGKEKTGLEYCEADLFQGKNYILTPTSKTNRSALAQVKNILSKIGSKVVVMDAKVHDEVVAGISHLPVAVAASLVDSVMESGKLCDEMIKLASSGFKDTTRVASGDPILGTGMFITNKKAMLESIKSFKKCLSGIESLIRKGDQEGIKARLTQAKIFRDSIYK